MTISEETFKSRLQEFWRWYAEVAPRFNETIAAGGCDTLTTEINAKVDELADGLAWEFRPGTGGGGHSLTLSGEGNMHRQLLTIYWLERAPRPSQPRNNIAFFHPARVRLGIMGDYFRSEQSLPGRDLYSLEHPFYSAAAP